jgi:type IV secretory pathway VirB2 component (pilin)
MEGIEGRKKAMMELFMFLAGEGDGGIGSQISKAFKDVYSIFQSIANPIAVVAIAVMGIYLLIGSDPQTIKKVKTWAISIIVGMILVNAAPTIADWASKLGQSTEGTSAIVKLVDTM